MKTLYAFGIKRPIDMSLSENPLGCSVAVTKSFGNLSTNFSEYPKPSGTNLKIALAQHFGLSPDQFFIANGSESIIINIPRVFGQTGTEAVMPLLTFPMFKVCTELVGMAAVTTAMTTDLAIDLAAVRDALTPRTKIVFLCNPNNPTGGILAKTDLTDILDDIPSSVLVVVDEANIEFGGESLIAEVLRRPNLIVLRTLSKGFGLAGARVGFAVGQAALIQKLEEETQAFPISALSEQVAMIALEDLAFIDRTKAFVAQERVKLTRRLSQLGFRVFPSEANNLFVKIPDQIKAPEFMAALEAKGISVVAGSSFAGFDDRFFRISVRDELTNRRFGESVVLLTQ